MTLSSFDLNTQMWPKYGKDMYLYAQNDVPHSSGSKVIAWTYTQTHRQTLEWNYYLSAYADGNNNNLLELDTGIIVDVDYWISVDKNKLP